MTTNRGRRLRIVPLLLGFACWPGPSAGQDLKPATAEQIHELQQRIAELESRLPVQAEGEVAGEQSRPESVDGTASQGVDLSEEQVPYPGAASDLHVLARPWWTNLSVGGFAAVAYLDSGDAGTRPHGGFLIKESSFFVDAAAWEDISFFFEVQVNRLGKDPEKLVRTGEVHAHFRNLLKGHGENLLGLKVGRVDIPFGEEYLWQDASDNPLISTSAAYPYGFDEGVVIYGTLKGLGWIAAITDGTDKQSVEDNPAKAFNLKFYGDPSNSLYLSGSYMRNGKAGKSAFEFGGSHFEPVGASHRSSSGASGSDMVNATLYEVDAEYAFGDRVALAGSYGRAMVDDEDDAFDRDLSWFSVQPRLTMTQSSYAVLRYSEIGTYDSAQGYHFDGKTTAGGNASFGYDTERFKRLSIGVGWRPNPRVVVKGEVGYDWFDLIDGASTSGVGEGRLLSGAELVLIF